MEYQTRSPEEALQRILEEMKRLEADADEPVVESVSREWFRLNLLAVIAKGIKEEDIALMLYE